VQKAGPIPFRVEGDLRRMQVFVDGEQVVLPDDGEAARVAVELAAGSHRLVVVGLPGTPGESRFRIELLGPVEQVTVVER
jgi:hypothetical protein